jgi:threonine/homoserine/homoserine lactone efflux protein
VAQREASAAAARPHVAFGHGLLITMTNPLTIAAWLAVAGSLAVSEGDLVRLFVAAAFIAVGTLTWFTFLSGAAAWGRRLVGDLVVRWVSLMASLVILAFAIRFLAQGLGEYLL